MVSLRGANLYQKVVLFAYVNWANIFAICLGLIDGTETLCREMCCLGIILTGFVICRRTGASFLVVIKFKL